MEPIRLHGRERYEWERNAVSRLTRSRQLVFRVLLEFCGGKAECWPCNATLARVTGLSRRSIQLILRDLEALGVVRSFQDHGIPSQRRIVLLGHPGSLAAIKKRGANPSRGAQKRERGAQKPTPPGAQKIAPEAFIEPQEESPVARPTDDGQSGDGLDPIWARFGFRGLRAGVPD